MSKQAGGGRGTRGRGEPDRPRTRRCDPVGVGAQLHELAASGSLARLPLAEIGGLLRDQLCTQTLPTWCRMTLDRRYGGFRIDDQEARARPVRRPGRDRGRGETKQLVSQSRMLWNLSHAQRLGLRPPRQDLLTRAADGYRFLERHFRDPVHGGYFWRVTRSGRAVDDDLKVLYGQAFVIFAFVEFHRASGDHGPLDAALELFETVTDRLHDDEHGGWNEHAAADWAQPDADRRARVERIGHKSANAHLHWMEALAPLAEATTVPAVSASLGEVVDILSTHFYPSDPAAARSLCTPDWRAPAGHDAPISLGHHVEFAWLLLHAEQALGREISTDRFLTYLDHALDVGFDATNGGLDTQSPSVGAPSSPRGRIWWVQAELLAALDEAVTRGIGGARHDAALRRQLGFVFAHQVDPLDGLWWTEVDDQGRVTRPWKHHQWKAAYHELRAMTLPVERSACRPAP